MSNIYPKIQFKFKDRDFKFKKSKDNNILIWDIVRKRYVSFTPEEMVRQHVIHALVYDYNVPLAWISVEKSLNFNGLTKRFDIMVLKHAQYPYLLVECKSPEVSITVNTLLQISSYQSIYNAQYLMITNGTDTSVMTKINEEYQWIESWDATDILL